MDDTYDQQIDLLLAGDFEAWHELAEIGRHRDVPTSIRGAWSASTNNGPSLFARLPELRGCLTEIKGNIARGRESFHSVDVHSFDVVPAFMADGAIPISMPPDWNPGRAELERFAYWQRAFRQALATL